MTTTIKSACPNDCGCHEPENVGRMAESPACCPFMGTVLDGLSPETIARAAKDMEADGSIALEAHRLVYGDRQKEYSHPFDDFSRTASFWTDAGFTRNGKAIEPEDIGYAMIFVKMSRLAHDWKRDSIVDLAGYAETIRRVLERKRELGITSIYEAPRG